MLPAFTNNDKLSHSKETSALVFLHIQIVVSVFLHHARTLQFAIFCRTVWIRRACNFTRHILTYRCKPTHTSNIHRRWKCSHIEAMTTIDMLGRKSPIRNEHSCPYVPTITENLLVRNWCNLGRNLLVCYGAAKNWFDRGDPWPWLLSLMAILVFLLVAIRKGIHY